MEFHHATLENGLEIVAEINRAVHSVAMGFFVKAGSRDEALDVHGVSHFLEHMAFKGTDRFSADDVNRLFDEVGADYNAATTEEMTLFYSATLPEYLPQTFEVQAAILQPTLRQDDFDTEKQVILEEIGMYDDQPAVVAYDQVMQTHFHGHPLERTILGTTASIAALTAEQMQRYHREHYSAGNIVLAVAGNVSWPEVLDLAKRHCQSWPQGKCPRTLAAAPSSAGCQLVTRPSLQQEQVVQMAAAPDAHDPLRFAAELLTVIVGDDQNSRMYWDIVDPGHAELAELNYNDFDDSGTYLLYLSGDPDEAETNLARATAIFDAVNQHGVTDAELKQAKTKSASRIVLRGERPMGRLSSLGGNWVSRQEYRTIADDLRTLEAITQDDIHRLLARYPLRFSTTVGVGPLTRLESRRSSG